VNEISQNNQCLSCGPKAIAANMAADNNLIFKCMPCQGRLIAQLIGGVMTCAADCSSVGGSGKGRTSSNYITDPKDLARCIPCKYGSKPNDSHTACITTVSLDALPKGPATSTREPASLTGKTKRTTKGGAGSVVKVTPGPPNKGEGSVVKQNPGPPTIGRQKGKAGASAVKRDCPPRMHTNPSGTACVPDLDMPGITDTGSSRPGGPASRRGR
jgi:hypothetical protein